MLEIPGYTIKSKLGAGGMAVVYLAIQDSLDREVALKVMLNSEKVSQLDKSEKNESNHKERFIHEGHDLAALQHPNIVTIHDISHTGEHCYYAMEFLKYGSLHERLRNGVSLKDAFNIVLQVGSALECAHQNNIIHRDLKPDNILFRDPATPILTDFGIAKNRARDTHLTQSGGLLGTPCYMSPEQCRGLNVDARSDQYSLCVLFFELITGYLPFDANETIAIAMKQISDPIPLLPVKLSALQWFIDIAMDKTPQNRFTSVGEFCRVLNDMMLNESSLQSQLETIIYRSPMDSDTIQREVLLDDYESEDYGLDSFKSDPFSSLTGGTIDSLSLPTEDVFWNKGQVLKKWFFILLIFTSAGFGGYYYVTHYSAGLTSINERDISALMRQAERQVSVSQLSVPKGNNAYETLNKVLALEPNHQIALQMMEEAAATYEVRALEYLAKQQLNKAQRQIERGFKFSKNHKGLKNAQVLLNKELVKIEKIDDL